ncbi:hypothetical protein [Puerhibacterium puerhi]|uniref:hypothetical protein n=1 Tax=Puerhibacterium puerhi TaxID=2692623 RepID=UPI00135AA6A6|nr:hypothetical protein [Puerhibacterium puerhi]
MAAPTTVRPTGDLGLLLPADWWVVPLTDRRAMRRSLAALADRQFGRPDRPVPLKHQTRQALERTAETAAAAGGRILAISLMTVRERPLTITLTTFRQPPPSRVAGPSRLERVAERLRAGAAEGTEVLLGEGPAGPVLRTVTVERGPAELGAQDIDQLVVRYLVDVGDRQGHFEAVFASPHVELREGLLDLYDTLVASVGHVPSPDDPHEGPQAPGAGGAA